MSLFENRFFQRDIEFPDLLLFEFSSLGELLLLMLVEKARFRIEDSLIGGGFSGLKMNKVDKFIQIIFETPILILIMGRSLSSNSPILYFQKLVLGTLVFF